MCDACLTALRCNVQTSRLCVHLQCARICWGYRHCRCVVALLHDANLANLANLASQGELDSGDTSMGASADPACLLRLYMQYGRPAAAASLLLRHLGRWSRQVAGRTPAPGSAWFPYALVPALLSQLEGLGEMGMVQTVAGAVDAHVQLVQHKQSLLRPGSALLRVAAPEAMDAMM